LNLYFCSKITQDMLSDNIFKLIGDFFVNVLFKPYDAIREIALGNGGWWLSNAINFLFFIVLLVLLGYWIKLSLHFKKTNAED